MKKPNLLALMTASATAPFTASAAPAAPPKVATFTPRAMPVSAALTTLMAFSPPYRVHVTATEGNPIISFNRDGDMAKPIATADAGDLARLCKALLETGRQDLRMLIVRIASVLPDVRVALDGEMKVHTWLPEALDLAAQQPMTGVHRIAAAPAPAPA